MKDRPASAQKGSALVAVLMVAALLIAVFLVFSSWTSFGTKTVVHTLQTQKAVYIAESGYYAALTWLKTPAAVNLSTNTTIVSGLTPGATYYLSMSKSLTDSSIVNLESTGYFETPSGHFVDPLGLKAEKGIIDAQVRVEGVKDYFAAVPGTLGIAYGSNLSNSRVYGKDLIFLPPGTGPTSQVGEAFYFNSVTGDTSANVTYVPGPPFTAQKLPTEPGLPQVTPMRDSYYSMAADPTGPCILPAAGGACTLSGSWTAPSPLNPSNVCFCHGDLHMGAAGQPLTVSGDVLIFVEGSTYVDNSVSPAVVGTDWLAIASEGDVSISINPPVPDALTVYGTFITDGAIKALGNPRANGTLDFYGGMVAQKGISLTVYGKRRTYTYMVPNSALTLPYLVQSITWSIRHGNNL
jgi:hypothetical protein